MHLLMSAWDATSPSIAMQFVPTYCATETFPTNIKGGNDAHLESYMLKLYSSYGCRVENVKAIMLLISWCTCAANHCWSQVG